MRRGLLLVFRLFLAEFAERGRQRGREGFLAGRRGGEGNAPFHKFGSNSAMGIV